MENERKEKCDKLFLEIRDILVDYSDFTIVNVFAEMLIQIAANQSDPEGAMTEMLEAMQKSFDEIMDAKKNG